MVDQKNESDNSGDTVESNSYHPSYSSPEADLVLCSSDGIKFCVHTVIMSIASEVFKNMINGAADSGEVLHLQERSEILETMLNMIYPIGFFLDLPGKSFDFVWDLIAAADKYGVQKILEEFHVRIITDSHFQNQPLESYAIAVRCGWDDEIRAVSYWAIDFIHNDGAWDILRRIDAKKASDLLKLPSRRREFVINNLNLNTRRKSEPAYIVLKHLVERELFVRPSGDTLHDEFWRRPEVSSYSCYKAEVIKLLNDKNLPSCVP